MTFAANLIPFILLAILVGSSSAFAKTPVDWVDPTIDTDSSRWFYFSSACRPFGMVNLSPDTQTKGSWKSGYLYGGKHIRCFSHIHAWQLAGIPVMPIVGKMTGHLGMDAYQSEFSHEDEVVHPGYHKVFLKKYGVTAELTSTDRVGFHRYRYPASRDAYVLFDVGAFLGHAPMLQSQVRRVSDTEIAGMSLMKSTVRRKKNTPVYFVARFSQPMTEFGGWEKGTLPSQLPGPAGTIAGAGAGAYIRFTTRRQSPLLMKVAISYTSVEAARKNLLAELDHWDFDRVVKESVAQWNELLSRIEVAGGTAKQKTKFYTDLWHALQGRRIVSDADGAYSDMTGAKPVVRRVPVSADGTPAFDMHNFDAFWGSHWSLNILWPLLCPERYSAICNTMVQMYKDGGLIPRGPSGGNYTFVMIGDSSVPFISAAYGKGIRDFDFKTALEGLVKNTGPNGGRYYGGYATRPSPAACEAYRKRGYVPLSTPLKGFHGKAVSSLTLYNSYHDWCIANMAHSLGQNDIYNQFIKGSKNYRHVIWPEMRTAWSRLDDGSWTPGFRPKDDIFEQPGFCEASAAVSTFWVPHDPIGLATLLGGPAATAQQLYSQFQASAEHAFRAAGQRAGNALVDYTNQEATGMAHFFNRTGYPWLSQKWVRAVHEATFSGTDPNSGYHGDEDQGQMGALSALMAMGLFQFDGGAGQDSAYDITAPVFDKVTIHLSPKYYGGKTVTVTTTNQAAGNVYIQSAQWNAKAHNSCLLKHSTLIQGGSLELELGPHPNKNWGLDSPR